MKKYLSISLGFIAVLTLVLSCNKVNNNLEPENPTGNPAVNVPSSTPKIIRVSIPEEMTKVSFTQDENPDGPVKLAWVAGDEIVVSKNGESTDKRTFTIISESISNNGHSADFELKEGEETMFSADKYDISYNSAGSSFNYGQQTQSTNANTANLKYVASLTGVNTYEDIEFSTEWATNKGGTFAQSSILRLRVQVPDEVTEVASIAVSAPDVSFAPTVSCITVNFSNSLDTRTDKIVSAYAVLPATSIEIPANTNLTIIVKDGSGFVYAKEVAAGGTTLAAGKVNAIKINKTGFTSKFAGGTGVDGDPWLIANKWQLLNVDPAMVDNETKYFKMIADVDMEGVTWVPLNNHKVDNDYKRFVNFDGGDNPGHIISNLNSCFFYVFKGSIKNLTLSGSNVKTRGIFAEFCQGTGHTITNVDITGGSMATTSPNGGALIGRINNGSGTTVTITACDVTNTTVSGAAQTGGLIGSAEATVEVKNCTVVKSGSSTSSVNASGANCGGLIGQTTGDVVITNCTVSNTDVTGAGFVGGVVGYANSADDISDCNYSGGTVTASGQYVGGFVGQIGNFVSSFSNCGVEDATINANQASDPRGGGFAGLVYNKVTVKGCTVGTSTNKVVIKTKQPASNKVLNVGGFAGVNYGKITNNGDNRNKAYVKITSENTLGQPLNIGGFVGYHTGTIEYSDAVVDMSDLQGQVIGGFAGTTPSNSAIIDHCTVNGSVKGNNYTGMFIGKVDKAAKITNNTAEGPVSGQSSVGGFVGYCENNPTFTDNTTSATTKSNGSNVGGFVGAIESATMTRCSATGKVEKLSSTSNDYGGFAGYTNNATLDGCYSKGTVDVDVAQTETVGGFIGQVMPATGNLTKIDNCYSESKVEGSGRWTGGFIGYIYKASDNCGDVEITKCHASGDVSVTGKNYVAGFIGRTYMVSGSHLYIDKCYATGNVSSTGSGASAFIGEIGEATICSITDCFCTGAITGSNQQRGGLVAIVNANANTSVTISRCYSSSEVTGSFRLGGLIGNIAGTNCTMEDCAAWNSAVTASSAGQINWSSGAVVGTAHPNCHITNTFRNPNMSLTVYCPPPTADWDHPDIDGATTPLYQNSQTAPFTWAYTTATALSAGSGNADAGRWAYHGKHSTTNRLSTLASTAKASGGLGWSSTIWDFSDDLPTLN